MTTAGLLPLAWSPPRERLPAPAGDLIHLDLAAPWEGPFCAPPDWRAEAEQELADLELR